MTKFKILILLTCFIPKAFSMEEFLFESGLEPFEHLSLQISPKSLEEERKSKKTDKHSDLKKQKENTANRFCDNVLLRIVLTILEEMGHSSNKILNILQENGAKNLKNGFKGSSGITIEQFKFLAAKYGIKQEYLTEDIKNSAIELAATYKLYAESFVKHTDWLKDFKSHAEMRFEKLFADGHRKSISDRKKTIPYLSKLQKSSNENGNLPGSGYTLRNHNEPVINKVEKGRKELSYDENVEPIIPLFEIKEPFEPKSSLFEEVIYNNEPPVFTSMKLCEEPEESPLIQSTIENPVDERIVESYEIGNEFQSEIQEAPHTISQAYAGSTRRLTLRSSKKNKKPEPIKFPKNIENNKPTLLVIEEINDNYGEEESEKSMQNDSNIDVDGCSSSNEDIEEIQMAEGIEFKSGVKRRFNFKATSKLLQIIFDKKGITNDKKTSEKDKCGFSAELTKNKFQQICEKKGITEDDVTEDDIKEALDKTVSSGRGDGGSVYLKYKETLERKGFNFLKSVFKKDNKRVVENRRPDHRLSGNIICSVNHNLLKGLGVKEKKTSISNKIFWEKALQRYPFEYIKDFIIDNVESSIDKAFAAPKKNKNEYFNQNKEDFKKHITEYYHESSNFFNVGIKKAKEIQIDEEEAIKSVNIDIVKALLNELKSGFPKDLSMTYEQGSNDYLWEHAKFVENNVKKIESLANKFIEKHYNYHSTLQFKEEIQSYYSKDKEHGIFSEKYKMYFKV